MEKFNTLISVLVVVLGIMSVIMPFVIEFIKNMIGQEKIITLFGKLERFCAFATSVVSLLIYILLCILCPEYFIVCNIIQIIAFCFIFMFICAMASQIGYDKIIKWIINGKGGYDKWLK